MARKPQPKPLTRAQVEAMSDDQLQRVVNGAGGAALILGSNPKHDRTVRRLISNHDLAADELTRRGAEAR